MKIVVTGATGFIGNHVIKSLLSQGHEVMATSTSAAKASSFSWFNKVKFLELKLEGKEYKENIFDFFQRPDAVIHLAWEGLPNYKNPIHIDKNLFSHYFFLKNLVENGLQNLNVTGTCFEYGMQSGLLSEDLPPSPSNPYALAKDKLRQMIESLKSNHTFHLKWIRLFYMYGEGQNSNSIIPLLQKAIDNEEKEFKMSGGEQLRDYLPVSSVAENIVAIATQNSIEGIVNCCSGRPITVRKLVEDYIQSKGSNIRLCLGHYPYQDYEPMAFWGDAHKLNKILSANEKF